MRKLVPNLLRLGVPSPHEVEQAFPSTPKGNLLLLTVLTRLTFLPPVPVEAYLLFLTPSEQRVYLPPTPVEGMGGAAHVGRENILRNRRMENPVERGFLLLPTSGWDLPPHRREASPQLPDGSGDEDPVSYKRYVRS